MVVYVVGVGVAVRVSGGIDGGGGVVVVGGGGDGGGDGGGCCWRRWQWQRRCRSG